MMFFWRKKRVALPLPEGPYATGCVDLMSSYTSDSLFVRLLYPTDVSKSDFKKYENRWIPWVQDDKYVQSFAILLRLWTFLLRIIIWLFGKETYIPTLWEEPASSKLKKLPVVVFSHGYGSTRFLCSTACNELASRGYLVASLEHKDLSASVTYYYDSEDSKIKDKRTYMMHQVLDITSKEHYSIRNMQMKSRSMECSKLLDALQDINNGTFLNKSRTNMDLNSFKGKLDLSSPVIMGHSFGGATAMYTLATDKRYKFGIILDGWMFPIKKEDLDIQQPMLFINSQTFHIAANIELMNKFTSQEGNSLYTIKNTTHESHTDTPIVYGHWLNIFMKKLDIEVALKIQNYLILQFLHKNAGLDLNEDTNQEYLNSQRINICEEYILHSKSPKKAFTVF